MLGLVAGCDPAPEPSGQDGGDDEGESDTEEEEETLMPPPGESMSSTDPTETGTTGDTDTETDTDGCNFFECDETGDTNVEPLCSVWDQDCGDGEKCNPYADDGGPIWNAAKCVQIANDPGQPGDPCEVFGGGTSGEDTCDIGAMCWANNEDGTGVCIGLCGGTQNNPLCDDVDDTCTIWNEGFLPLCSPTCHPLAQDCQIDAMGCYPTIDGDFTCLFDSSGDTSGAFADPCQAVNACDEGLLCGGAAIVPECNSASCCTEFCDLMGEQSCSGAADGQECLPFFEEGETPPDYTDVGFCGIPQQ